jgi:hypothetical protein
MVMPLACPSTQFAYFVFVIPDAAPDQKPFRGRLRRDPESILILPVLPQAKMDSGFCPPAGSPGMTTSINGAGAVFRLALAWPHRAPIPT